MSRQLTPASPSESQSTNLGRALAAFALIFGALLVVYFPALHGTLLWDDAGHVTRPDLQSLHGLRRIWFEIGATQQYYPVLHSAFWFEHRLWGDSVFAYHLLNLLLHASAAVFFGAVLRRLVVPGAWFAAALFAFHPVCVESVAWISEQKNTLSAVFYLAAALVYLRFDDSRRWSTYALATALFILALLTKTVTATLPAALLVVFWWRRGQLNARRDALPLLPWLAAGIGSGLFTAYFEKKLIGAEGTDFALTLFDRVVLAGRVFWFYLGKLAWPADLMFIYPRWNMDSSVAWQWTFTIGALVLLMVLVGRSRRSRAPLAAALIFGGTLFPVLGFVNVFPFLFSYVADHFQYLASLAVFAIVGAGAAQLSSRFTSVVRYAVALAILGLFAVLSRQQSSMYRDVFTLYEKTLAQNPACWMAHHNLATALAEIGRVQEAIPHGEEALRLRPNFPEALNNLGDDWIQLQQPDKAIPLLEKALQLQPRYAVAHRNLGRALAMSDRTAEAIPHFEEAARLNPADPEAELNWGLALMFENKFSAAVAHFERACALDPTANAHLMYGRALVEQRRFQEAAAHFRAALAIDPQSTEAQENLTRLTR